MCVEPGTFAMRSESHTTTSQARMQSKCVNVEQSHVIHTVNKQRQVGMVIVIFCLIP